MKKGFFPFILVSRFSPFASLYALCATRPVLLALDFELALRTAKLLWVTTV